MSYKGPSSGDPLGPGASPWSGGPPAVGTGDAPNPSTGFSDPGGPVTWPPRRPSQQAGRPPYGSSFRPIPLSPEGVRRESSMPREPSATRAFRHFFRHTSISTLPSTD